MSLTLITALAVHGQDSPLSTCPLDPELDELREGCARGAGKLDAETCAVLHVLELLARGERSLAEEILTRDLALPEASRERMMPWLEFLGRASIDLDDSPTECTQAQAQRMLNLVGAGLYDGLKQPEALLLLGLVMGWSEVVMGKLEERLDPTTAAAVETVTHAVAKLLHSAQFGRLMIESLRSNPILGMVAGQLPQISSGRSEEESEARHGIDPALDLAREGKLDEARDTASEALALEQDLTHRAKLLIRAGIGLLVGGFPEEGLDFLRRVDTLLVEQGADDPDTRSVRAVAQWFLALAYDELGLEEQKDRVAASARYLVDGEAGEVLNAVGRSFLKKDQASSAAAIQVVAEKISAGELEEQEIWPLMEIIMEVVPGLDTATKSVSRETPTIEETALTYPEYIMQISELVIQERFEAAGALAEEMILHFPQLNNVYLLVLSAGKQWMAGDHSGALVSCRRAIEILETKIEAFRVDEIQIAVTNERVYMPFRMAIEMAGLEGRKEEAFEYAERLRAWTLRRLLGGPRSMRGVVSEPSQKEKELLTDIHEKERELKAASGELRLTLESELSTLRNEFAAHRLKRKLDVADQQDLARVGAVTLDELQHEILDPATTLLVYGAGLDDLWAWVVERDSIEMVQLPLPEEEQLRIAEQVLTLRGRPADISESRGVDPLATHGNLAAETLYNKLIAPVAEFIWHERLIVVPHGLLHHLPFAALRNPTTGRYLVEDFTLSLAPSVSALKLLSPSMETDSHRRSGVLVLGDPITDLGGLQGARREAKAVSRLFGLTPLLAEKATETAVYTGAAQAGLLHLAAHGEYLPENPIFSRIRLKADSSHDGYLEMHEVWDRLDLNGTLLVTLSGCETALGESTRGDEVIGLTQAFLVAGSRAVLSTLWPVDDEASEKLMVKFYQRLRGGTPAAEALRSAQLELLRDSQYDAPYFWAGYALTGDPQIRWMAASGESAREERILTHIKRGAYRDAIREVAAWELEVEKARPPATFQAGHFHSEPLHLAFDVPGEWERFDPSGDDSAARLRSLGFSIELILKDKSSEAMFILMTNDSLRIAQAFGAEPVEVPTDEMMLNQVMASASSFSGTLSSHEFVTNLKVGKRVLVARILGPGEQFVIDLAVIPDGGLQHLMMLISIGNGKDAAKDRLRQILQTVERASGKAISRLHLDLVRRAHDSQKPTEILTAVCGLLATGDYGLAATELAWLRQLIASAIPGPRIDGNTARWTAYGISLENPNPEIWRLDVQGGPLGVEIFLADPQSEEGLEIMVIDMLARAPAIASLLESPPEDTRVLVETAQHISQEMGTEIEKEEFTTLHGRLAYQVTLGTMAGGMRARLLLQTRADYVVGVLLLATSEHFEQQVKRYEDILRGRRVQLGR